MNFIQETGRKRNTADNRRKVSAFAAHAGWAENRIRKNGPVPGSRIWVSEAGNNSRGRHRRASAVVAGYHAAGRMEGAPSDPRYRIDRVVSTLLHDIPPEVCSDALDYCQSSLGCLSSDLSLTIPSRLYSHSTDHMQSSWLATQRS